MKRRGGLSLLVTAPMSLAAIAEGQGRYALTAEGLTGALAGVRGGGPFQLSIAAAKVSRGHFRIVNDSAVDLADAVTFLKEAPFEMLLFTLDKRAAITAAEARRQFADPPQLTVEPLNADGIEVSVAPAGTVMRRGGRRVA
jgi:hypothetical protein